MTDRRYMVLVVRPWSSVRVCVQPFGGEQPLVVDGLGVGFIPVFESREEALAFAGGDDTRICVLGVGRPEEDVR